MNQLKQPLVIAIDGHSSCGKSSFAKLIAKEFGLLYIDSGAMYRALTLFALRNGLINDGIADAAAIENHLSSITVDFQYNSNTLGYETFLNGENIEKSIRTMEVSENVSEVSKIKAVRTWLVSLQRKIGENKSIVMDGRDIGTVVFPNADIKIFMTASLEVRAERRFKELEEKGIPVSIDDISENLSQRDYIDQNRAESPLRKANDAITLDNSNMTLLQQMEWFKNIFKIFCQ
jgi:cytidylate kinase